MDVPTQGRGWTCSWVRISFPWRPNLEGECDNHIVELAVAPGANGIVELSPFELLDRPSAADHHLHATRSHMQLYCIRERILR